MQTLYLCVICIFAYTFYSTSIHILTYSPVKSKVLDAFTKLSQSGKMLTKVIVSNLLLLKSRYLSAGTPVKTPCSSKSNLLSSNRNRLSTFNPSKARSEIFCKEKEEKICGIMKEFLCASSSQHHNNNILYVFRGCDLLNSCVTC